MSVEKSRKNGGKIARLVKGTLFRMSIVPFELCTNSGLVLSFVIGLSFRWFRLVVSCVLYGVYVCDVLFFVCVFVGSFRARRLKTMFCNWCVLNFQRSFVARFLCQFRLFYVFVKARLFLSCLINKVIVNII